MLQKRKTIFSYWSLLVVFIFVYPSSLYSQRTTRPFFDNREYNLYLINFSNWDTSYTTDTALARIHTKERSGKLLCLSQSWKNIFGIIPHYKFRESIDSILYPRAQKKNYFVRKIRRESFIRVDQKDFYLALDPIFNFSGGIDLGDSLNEKLITNSRGVWARGNIGEKFAFESTFFENQSTFPDYLDAFADTFKVVPGQGRWKKFKTNGYDYAASSGTISYAPFHFLSIQAGHGKPFIGSGYRSLLLSDNAFNYPFAKITLWGTKIRYSVIYASLQVVDKVRNYTTNLNEPLFKKKSATFQYLTLYPLKAQQLAISLFQGTVFQVRDSIHPNFNWNSLNPLIYSSAIQYGLNSSPNVLLGADAYYRFLRDFEFYGQYVLDDFSSSQKSLRNKSGFQLGAKYYNVLGLKNLIFQVEYNQVRPYTYAHKIPAESYTHYGQSLTHPLGSNFKEWVGFINYHWKDFFIELKMNYATYGADSSGKSYGKEIFESDNFSANGINSKNNSLLQGMKTNLIYEEVKLSYLINSASNLNVFVQLINRQQSTPLAERNNTLIYFGVKTSLFNNYYDF